MFFENIRKLNDTPLRRGYVPVMHTPATPSGVNKREHLSKQAIVTTREIGLRSDNFCRDKDFLLVRLKR